LYTAH